MKYNKSYNSAYETMRTGVKPKKLKHTHQACLANVLEELDEIKKLATSIVNTTAKLVSTTNKVLCKIGQSSDNDKAQVSTPQDTKYSHLARVILSKSPRTYDRASKVLFPI